MCPPGVHYRQTNVQRRHAACWQNCCYRRGRHCITFTKGPLFPANLNRSWELVFLNYIYDECFFARLCTLGSFSSCLDNFIKKSMTIFFCSDLVMEILPWLVGVVVEGSICWRSESLDHPLNVYR